MVLAAFSVLHTAFLAPSSKALCGRPARGERVVRTPGVSLLSGEQSPAQGGEWSSVPLVLGVLIGLYVLFLVSYGFLDCTDGNYSPTSIAKCTLVDTLLGADDIRFQVG